MIHGLLLDVKADELIARLRVRVAHHESKAKAYELQLRKQAKASQTLEEDHDGGLRLSAPESPVQKLARKKREHAERAVALKFVRDHVVRGEVYRLGESDLRLAELVPDRFSKWRW